MNTQAIITIPNQPVAILRADFLRICDNNKAAALLLSLFSYWHTYKITAAKEAKRKNDVAEMHGDERTQDESLYQFYTAQELHERLMGLVGRQAIETGVELLKSKGYITIHKNPNPRYKFDKTRHFLLHPDVVNNDLRIAFTTPTDHTNSVESSTPNMSDSNTDLVGQSHQNGRTVAPNMSDSSPNLVGAIPKYTSKNTTEVTPEITTEKKDNIFQNSESEFSEMVERLHALRKQAGIALRDREMHPLAGSVYADLREYNQDVSADEIEEVFKYFLSIKDSCFRGHLFRYFVKNFQKLHAMWSAGDEPVFLKPPKTADEIATEETLRLGAKLGAGQGIDLDDVRERMMRRLNEANGS